MQGQKKFQAPLLIQWTKDPPFKKLKFWCAFQKSYNVFEETSREQNLKIILSSFSSDRIYYHSALENF